MAEVLNDIERRVLGVLLEKSLAQPQYYPMTLNAIVAACNQKSNRDPVMDLDEEAVWATLEALRTRAIVSRLLPGSAGRVERFRHEAQARFGWEKPQRAVMAELLLRGPQTVGELRSRCTRLYPFENAESVAAVLDNLAQADPSMAAPLARAPGQSAARWAHKLYREEEWAAIGTAALAAAVPTAAVPTAAVPTAASPTAADPDARAAAAAAHAGDEPGALRQELSALRDELATLRQRVEALEQRQPR